MHNSQSFWNDESGSIVSAEMVTIGAIVAMGAVTAAQTASSTIDDELRDVSKAIRNLNQSYSYKGFRGCNAVTAGSTFAGASNVLPLEPPEKSPGKSPEKTPGKDKVRNSAQRSEARQASEEGFLDTTEFEAELDDEDSGASDDNY